MPHTPPSIFSISFPLESHHWTLTFLRSRVTLYILDKEINELYWVWKGSFRRGELIIQNNLINKDPKNRDPNRRKANATPFKREVVDIAMEEAKIRIIETLFPNELLD